MADKQSPQQSLATVQFLLLVVAYLTLNSTLNVRRCHTWSHSPAFFKHAEPTSSRPYPPSQSPPIPSRPPCSS
jgi:hypothetical protein